MKLSKSTVGNLSFTSKEQVFYWDDDLPGFGLYLVDAEKRLFI